MAEFDIRREVVLPVGPEQVFEAVTTGQANWLFPMPATPEPEAWAPPTHFAVRQVGEDGWFNALEYVIEAREGGTAVLRYVHSGVFTDDWDNQYDGASKHTDFYLHTLGQYLGHFAGRSATYVSVSGPEPSRKPDAVETLKRAAWPMMRAKATPCGSICRTAASRQWSTTSTRTSSDFVARTRSTASSAGTTSAAPSTRHTTCSTRTRTASGPSRPGTVG